MTLRVLAVVLLASVSSIPCTDAGEIIIRFGAGVKTHEDDVVLTNVPVKALVAEFLDPGDTGTGKSIGYLLWREILTAISDQAGAGVILARAPGEERITDMLEKAYHSAAVRIAKEQKASMAVWGVVNTAGDDLYVSTYLSLPPETADVLVLYGTYLPQGLQAEITRRNYNFPLVETTRALLFDRRIVTRKQVMLRKIADSSGQVVVQLPKDKALDAVDMEKGWFKVRLANGKFGYLDNSVVDVPPRTIEAMHVSTTLKATPGGQQVRNVTLTGTYRVLDMRYVAKSGLWYELAVDQARGWIPARMVRARFSLPIVHFVAGLYRYQFQRYEDAQREFAQYVSAPNSLADNPSLASGYQLLGASTLLTTKSNDLNPSALEHFSKAVNATPYDPAAYSLRALSTLAVSRMAETALEDLEEALRLDPRDHTAIRMIHVLLEWTASPNISPGFPYGLLDRQNPLLRKRLEDLARAYPMTGD